MEEEIKADEQHIAEAERLINFGHYDEARLELIKVKEKNARWYFVQGKLYKFKKWLNEARKCFETAIKMEPDNEEYKQALENLDKFKGTFENECDVAGKKQMDEENCCNCCLNVCDGCGSGCSC